MLDIIQKLCKEKGITIAELERKADLGNGTIRRWDKSYPSIDKAMNVANILNVSVDYLYHGKEGNISTVAARKMDKLELKEQEAVENLIQFFLNQKEKGE